MDIRDVHHLQEDIGKDPHVAQRQVLEYDRDIRSAVRHALRRFAVVDGFATDGAFAPAACLEKVEPDPFTGGDLTQRLGVRLVAHRFRDRVREENAHVAAFEIGDAVDAFRIAHAHAACLQRFDDNSRWGGGIEDITDLRMVLEESLQRRLQGHVVVAVGKDDKARCERITVKVKADVRTGLQEESAVRERRPRALVGPVQRAHVAPRKLDLGIGAAWSGQRATGVPARRRLRRRSSHQASAGSINNPPGMKSTTR